MKPKNIILVRHGESLANLDLQIHATVQDYKIPLTNKGKIQALNAGEKIKDMLESREHRTVAVYNSPFYRTRQTLQFIKHFIKDYIVGEHEDARLREQEYGHYRGKKEADSIDKQREEYGRFYFRVPDGENGGQVYDRQKGFLDTLYRDFEHENFPDNVLIVGHGFQIRILLMAWLHWSVEEFESKRNLENCEILQLILDETGHYKLLNDPLNENRKVI